MEMTLTRTIAYVMLGIGSLYWADVGLVYAKGYIRQRQRKRKAEKLRERNRRAFNDLKWDVYTYEAEQRKKREEAKKQVKIICKNPALADVFGQCI